MEYIKKLINTLVVAIILVVISLPTFAEDGIAILGLIADKAIISVDGVHHVVREGEFVADGIRLIKIGDNRKTVSLEIDGIEKQYRLGYGTNTAATTVKLPADASGIYRVTGKINNISVPFIVDTGATLITLNKNIAKQLGLDYVNAKQKGQAETANGIVPIYLVTLEQVEIGGIKLQNMQAAVHDSEFPRVALLGMSFLNQVDMKREGTILSLESK